MGSALGIPGGPVGIVVGGTIGTAAALLAPKGVLEGTSSDRPASDGS
jgi:hypothetical protein